MRKQIRQRPASSENTPNKSKILKRAQYKSNPRKVATPDFKIYAQSALISIRTFAGILAAVINFASSASRNGSSHQLDAHVVVKNSQIM